MPLSTVAYPPLVSLVLGVVLLLLGRKLFWFFVGVAGFIAGLHLAEIYFSGPAAIKLAVALAAGLIGALLAIVLQRVMVGIAGFVIGGYILTELLRGVAAFPPGWYWVIHAIGGIVGVLLVMALFDWALIILSSMAGAVLIIQTFTLHGPAMPVVYVVLVAIGILVQSAILRTTRVV